MSSPEMNLLNNANIRKTDQWYWLSSNFCFNFGNAYGRNIRAAGNMSGNIISDSFGVRPSISLIPGIEYNSGNGSMTNPYIVDIN